MIDMMNVIYSVVEERYLLEDGSDSRISYGIVAYANFCEDGTATVVASVHDITTDKQALFELVCLCNRLELSVSHLADMVEDFLAG